VPNAVLLKRGICADLLRRKATVLRGLSIPLTRFLHAILASLNSTEYQSPFPSIRETRDFRLCAGGSGEGVGAGAGFDWLMWDNNPLRLLVCAVDTCVTFGSVISACLSAVGGTARLAVVAVALVAVV
jgi:hypothetical protein